MADIESKILVRELGKLGGFGARLAARFLPNVVHEIAYDVSAPKEEVQTVTFSLLRELGSEVPELPGLTVVFGSGQMNLNPTIVSVEIAASGTGARVSIRGVAKEGAVKQNSARKAVERVAELLTSKYPPQLP